MAKLAGTNLAKDVYNDPKAVEVVKRIDYITVEGDKLKVRLRGRSE